MFIVKNPHILWVLQSLNKKGDAAIFGGYIRDTLLNIPPKDVDICTTLDEQEIKNIFPYATQRETINGHTILYFQSKGIFFEIVANVKNIEKKLKESDLTINSLGYDGESLIDLCNGISDIQNKLISYTSPEIFRKQLSDSPLLLTKTLRLISKTGFTFEENTNKLLQEHTHLLNSISDSIKTQEFYAIIFSKYNLNALHFMAKLDLVKDFDYNPVHNPFSDSKAKKTHYFVLTWMALNSSLETVLDFTKVFNSPDLIEENFLKLYNSLLHNEPPKNHKLLNEYMILKRYITL